MATRRLISVLTAVALLAACRGPESGARRHASVRNVKGAATTTTDAATDTTSDAAVGVGDDPGATTAHVDIAGNPKPTTSTTRGNGTTIGSSPKGGAVTTATTTTTTATSTTTTASTNTGSGACPDPRHCANYALNGNGRWRSDGDGNVVLHYRINAENPRPHTDLTTAQLVSAIQAAFATWADADPRLRFVYDGLTNDLPTEDNNTISFTLNGAAGAGTPHPGPDGYYDGFRILLSSTGITWKACDPANGNPCDRYDNPPYGLDLQALATHEIGHVLGIGHPPGNEASERLSMYGTMSNSTCSSVCRWADTLGLGDILAVRDLYPTSAPMPTLYDD